VLVATEEELRLLGLLTPDEWATKAPKRNIRNVTLNKAELTESGVVATLLLEGADALEDLERKHRSIRVMLDVLDEHLTDLAPGGRASKVLFAVRTRYITDELDMLWHPDITTLGRDTVTGEEVDIPRNERLLVGGASGSGKSWSTRALMARAVVHPDEKLACFIDGKGEEATVWRGVCPCAVEHEEIIDAIEEAHAEMLRRRDLLAAENLSVWNASLGPRLLYVIDEGQAVLQAVELEDKIRKSRRGDEDYEPDKTVMQKLVELSSQGRSRDVILMWMTQNPLRSGSDRGITSAIRANFDYGLCLRVNTPENTETVLNAGSGVEPHNLPKGTRFRGHAYLNVHGRNLLRTWTVTDDMVRLLGYPNHGRGMWPRDVALKTLHGQPDALWTPDLLASHTGCGRVQANRFLRTFSREGLMVADGDKFRFVPQSEEGR
jgi:S-DNA-T family DNA segregation ATPase FtsK/SpoIIIE